MADNERPAKIQKREHSPQDDEEAAFASSEQPGPANGSATTTETLPAQPAEDTTANAQDAADNNDDMDVDDAGDGAATPAGTASAGQPARPGPPPGMTKSAWKKQKRQQEWEAGREVRKEQRKEKNKARKERKRQAYLEGVAANDGDAAAAAPQDHPHKHQREQQDRLRSQKAVQLPITFVFDCSFDDLMMDKEMKSLGQQITRSYSDNRNSPYRAHLAVSSFGGNLKGRFDGLLKQHYKSWKGFRVFEEDFVEVAEKAKGWMGDLREGGRLAGKLAEVAERQRAEKAESSAPAQEGADAPPPPSSDKEGEIVYLSSEGTETLHDLKPYSTYIIGGLVDKNRYKGICHKRATERGIKTAKLPIGEFLQMNSRSVLATNHVNEIMLQWLACGDWGEAFMKVIPKRKGGQLRSTGEEDDEEAGYVEKDEAEEGSKAESAVEEETEATGEDKVEAAVDKAEKPVESTAEVIAD